MADERLNIHLDFDLTIAPIEQSASRVDIEHNALDPYIRQVYRLKNTVGAGKGDKFLFKYEHQLQCLLPPGFRVVEMTEQESADCGPGYSKLSEARVSVQFVTQTFERL